MDTKFAAVAAVVLLVTGCAQTGAVKPPAEPDVTSPVASATSHGPSTAPQQA